VGAGNDARQLSLRRLPAVHELAARLGEPHRLAVIAARRAVEEAREAIRRPPQELAGQPASEVTDAERVQERAREILSELQRPSLRRVLNATGVIVHTNLGRAPLPPAASEAVARVAGGYSNLELDLNSGGRGSRQSHVEALLGELTGAPAAAVVNNGAAAVLLAVSALAGRGGAVIVSRGQLVEIGGGFRIPEVIAQSGARMVEVGTTNRTRLEDYQRAVAVEPEACILRVHPSNFRTVGFVEEVEIEELCRIGVPVIDDVGSGVLTEESGVLCLEPEPPVRRSLAAGAAIVCCSGDKLLGGPQAGLMLGSEEHVARARRHPLARALRIDKLSLAALEATLALYRDPAQARREIPVLAMLEVGPGTLHERAERLREAIGAGSCELVEAVGRVGGGALPLLELRGPAVALTGEVDPAAVAAALRAGEPPLIARVHDGRLLLDPRTLGDDEVPLAAAAVRQALDAAAPA
jgi:L-seryl-tRNA(Ser) seleniumtransferase